MKTMFILQNNSKNRNGLLGIWEDVTEESLSFSSDYNREFRRDSEETVCAISLSDNPNKATAVLNRLESDLRYTHRAISEAGTSLQQIPSAEDVHFSVISEDKPEFRLYHHLEWLRNSRERSLSFGLDIPDRYSEITSDFNGFIRKVSQFLKPTLCIETRIQDALFAYTRADIDGDVKTFWNWTVSGGSAKLIFGPATGDEIFSVHAPLHQRSVSFTLDSRTAILQLFAQITAGAAALAFRFSLPGGAITALPAAWRYLQDIMAQAKEIREAEE